MQDIEIKKYKYIDALRGFAILGVVLVHTSYWVVPTSPLLAKIATQGTRGVQLFFMASALTLFLSMAARMNKEERPILSFYIRRFFRIAPAFYSAIIIYTAYYGMSPRPETPSGIEWWHILLTAAFMHGWLPETINSIVPGDWTIADEMTFYLFAPYLFVKINSVRASLIAIFVSLVFSKIATIAISHLISPYYPDSQEYLVYTFFFLWIFYQLPVFFTGILLYHLIIKNPTADAWTSFFLMASSLFLFVAFLNISTFEDLLPRHFMYSIAFLTFALSLNYFPNRLFVNQLTIWIGKLSFSIYLVHFMVFNTLKTIFYKGFVFDGNLGLLLAFLLVLTLSISISYVTYRLIEIPGINFGKQIIKKIQSKKHP